MSRYLMTVDESMRFSDLTNLQEGDVFYESEYGAVVKATVSSPVNIYKTDDGKDKVVFSATIELFDQENLKFLPNAEEASYLATDGLMHYGPKCYKKFYLWDREEQKEVDI